MVQLVEGVRFRLSLSVVAEREQVVVFVVARLDAAREHLVLGLLHRRGLQVVGVMMMVVVLMVVVSGACLRCVGRLALGLHERVVEEVGQVFVLAPVHLVFPLGLLEGEGELVGRVLATGVQGGRAEPAHQQLVALGVAQTLASAPLRAPTARRPIHSLRAAVAKQCLLAVRAGALVARER